MLAVMQRHRNERGGGAQQKGEGSVLPEPLNH